MYITCIDAVNICIGVANIDKDRGSSECVKDSRAVIHVPDAHVLAARQNWGSSCYMR